MCTSDEGRCTSDSDCGCWDNQEVTPYTTSHGEDCWSCELICTSEDGRCTTDSCRCRTDSGQTKLTLTTNHGAVDCWRCALPPPPPPPSPPPPPRPQPISEDCDTLSEVQHFFTYARVICCDQSREVCSVDQMPLPTTCSSPACASAMEVVHAKCGGYLLNGIGNCGIYEDLNTAAALCRNSPRQAESFGTVYDIQTTDQISGCHGTITDGEGDYDNGIVQQISILAPPGYSIQLIFEAFALAANDFLTIFDGRTQDNMIGQYTGSTLPPDITASSGQMQVTFQTNVAGSADGFRARIQCTCNDDATWTSSIGQGCEAYISGQRAYCASDSGVGADGQIKVADTACPVSCGRCTPCRDELCGTHGQCGDDGNCGCEAGFILTPPPSEPTWERMEGECISGNNLDVIPNMSIEDCKVQCTANIQCAAFEYVLTSSPDTGQARDCRLQSARFDDTDSCSNVNMDVYQPTATACGHFSRTQNTGLVGHNTHILPETSIDGCQAACCARSWCKSFDFGFSDGTCILADADSSTDPTAAHEGWDFYERPAISLCQRDGESSEQPELAGCVTSSDCGEHGICNAASCFCGGVIRVITARPHHQTQKVMGTVAIDDDSVVRRIISLCAFTGDMYMIFLSIQTLFFVEYTV
eukprot:SAG11_NODE_705_length_7655_cov_19.812599_1_plen_643_part_00